MLKRKWLVVGSGVIVAIGATIYLSAQQKRRPEMDDARGQSTVGLSTGTVAGISAREKHELPWSRFRGPNGTGISDDKNIPTEWSDSKNLRWKTRLPGLGASSPILTEQFVFVTSYSGYGESVEKAGDIGNLKRHISCIDRKSGDIIWTKTYDSEQREDPYQGMGVPEHGYATNSPVTDGETVFVFFGKSGVVALDMKGAELWKVSVGTSSGNRQWGSAASLMLYDDLLIVNAAEESQSLVALEKKTGKEVWKSEASTLELCYSTPAVVHVDEHRDDLVIAVPGEIWGLNPRNGKLTWFAETSLTGNLSPSVIVDDKLVYAFGGYRSSGSLAIKVGATGEIAQSDFLWSSRSSSYVATPVLAAGRLHWIDDHGLYYCTNAKDGELVHRARTPGINGGGRPVYASPIAIAGNIFVQTRTDGVFVIEPSDELTVLAQNKFESDSSVFNATPAVDGGQLFLRSDSFLYCVGK